MKLLIISSLFLISSQGFSQASQADDFLTDIASGLLWCYEQVGSLEPYYDEEGLCSPDSELSAWWQETSLAFSIANANFIYTPNSGGDYDSVGEYTGLLTFEQNNLPISYSLSAFFSGEDISVSVEKIATLDDL